MMNILVTLNANYIKPLKVMLKSISLNNQEENFSIYLIHSSLTAEEIKDLNIYIEDLGYIFNEIVIEEDYFTNAPTLLHYTKEMYYRLLAFKFLPQDLDRILYLDPDILVLNSLKELYNTDLEGYLYAAAYHNIIPIKEINKIRLGVYDMDAYYNSGVLLMNLDLQRQIIKEQEIYAFVEKNKAKLIMPDQDIINALYGKYIKNLEEKLYNYDARYFSYYKIMSNGKWDMGYVLRNTVILHFCGKKKPWQKEYSGKFHSLYKHYEKLAIG
ncbi:glycosyltransferase family 8 protein [Garciella nitratireducens]|uniref:Lipopolysaccharide biosynthesis protein, LPS:glycosyltransferase n=1 Tax=Garciella nitratireducens DSM 15102 TaxID=1121911 RepID=A0A1T4KFX4_9FIRM|nr:glycosyltransferase family 8 protein [Garciella nitratireducens]RBP42780.1 lipopolysaccharide biosynthesis glycosyltransferase [Garciella nitratireducens]SJZ41319.1 Lipopolysaccharide biosynthesis protein, LPS:glycosyltransferase [Garciella nitratireducens DSM 15102]